MAKAGTASGLTLPAPVKGLNFKDALCDMDPAYSPWMYNIIAENGYVRARYGSKAYATCADGVRPYLIAVFPKSNGTEQIWGLGYDGADYRVYDMTAGGSIGSSTVVNFFTTTKVFSVYHAGYLFIFDTEKVAGHLGVKFDGTNWTEITMGFHGNPQGAVSYKGRLYAIDRTVFFLSYSDIAQVAGATNEVDITSIFSKGGTMAWIAQFCAQDGITNQVYLAIGSTSGEVLIYGGDYPGSNTWSIVGRFIIGKPASTYPFGYRNVIEYQSDSLIITNCGLVSLRQLLQKGSTAATIDTISSNIDAYWSRGWTSLQASGISNLSWGGCYFPDEKKIIIYCNGFDNNIVGNYQTTASTIFIFNTVTGSWSVLYYDTTGGDFNSIAYANGKILIATSAGGGKGLFYHETSAAGYDTSSDLYTAYITSAWNNFGAQANIKRITAFEAIMYTDTNRVVGGLTAKTSADFGVSTSNFADVYRASPPSYQKLQFASGNDGTYLQYIIRSISTGNTGLPGFQLFGVNAIAQMGGLLS